MGEIYTLLDLRQKIKEYEQFEGQYEIITNLNENDIIKANSKVNIKCNKHNTITIRKIYPILINKTKFLCEDCKEEQIKKEKEEKFKELQKIFKERNYFLLETEYINAKTPIRYICLKHPYKIKSTTYNKLKMGSYGCASCALQNPKNKISEDYYIKECERRNLIFIKTQFENGITYVYYKCKIHPNEIIKIDRWNFINGNGRCKICHPISNGELIIKKFLNENNIKYESQKSFEGCKDKKLLRFDFYLPDYNLCIEYQGQQHYSPNFFIERTKDKEKGMELFNNNKKRDKIKKTFCQNNNINLLEIKYNQNTKISSILRKELKIEDELEN